MKKCNFCGTTDPHNHQFGCIGQMEEVPEPKKESNPRYEIERIYSKEECLKQADQMTLISATFYGLAQKCGHHQFIEFTGFMNKYIDLFRVAVNEGADPNACNTHVGLPLPGVRQHDIQYLAEKFDCLYGPTFHNQEVKAWFMKAMGWDKEIELLKEEIKLLKRYCDPKDIAFVESHLNKMREDT